MCASTNKSMMRSHFESHSAYRKIARAQKLDREMQNLMIALLEAELFLIFVMGMFQFLC